MAEKYNGIAKPLLLFEGQPSVPQAFITPAYGPWSSMSEAYAKLNEAFNGIANVPRAYTFCVINDNQEPEEYWLYEKGNWNSRQPKCKGSSPTPPTPTVNCTITFQNISPVGYTASMSYGGNTYSVTANHSYTVPQGITVTISVTCQGYSPYNDTKTINENYTVPDISLEALPASTKNLTVSVSPNNLSEYTLTALCNGVTSSISAGVPTPFPTGSVVTISGTKTGWSAENVVVVMNDNTSTTITFVEDYTLRVLAETSPAISELPEGVTIQANYSFGGTSHSSTVHPGDEIKVPAGTTVSLFGQPFYYTSTDPETSEPIEREYRCNTPESVVVNSNPTNGTVHYTAVAPAVRYGNIHIRRITPSNVNAEISINEGSYASVVLNQTIPVRYHYSVDIRGTLTGYSPFTLSIPDFAEDTREVDIVCTAIESYNLTINSVPSDASIRVSWAGQSPMSVTSGEVIHNVPKDAIVTVQVSKTGYNTINDSFSMPDHNETKTYQLEWPELEVYVQGISPSSVVIGAETCYPYAELTYNDPDGVARRVEIPYPVQNNIYSHLPYGSTNLHVTVGIDYPAGSTDRYICTNPYDASGPITTNVNVPTLLIELDQTVYHTLTVEHIYIEDSHGQTTHGGHTYKECLYGEAEVHVQQNGVIGVITSQGMSLSVAEGSEVIIGALPDDIHNYRNSNLSPNETRTERIYDAAAPVGGREITYTIPVITDEQIHNAQTPYMLGLAERVNGTQLNQYGTFTSITENTTINVYVNKERFMWYLRITEPVFTDPTGDSVPTDPGDVTVTLRYQLSSNDPIVTVPISDSDFDKTATASTYGIPEGRRYYEMYLPEGALYNVNATGTGFRTLDDGVPYDTYYNLFDGNIGIMGGTVITTWMIPDTVAFLNFDFYKDETNADADNPDTSATGLAPWEIPGLSYYIGSVSRPDEHPGTYDYYNYEGDDLFDHLPIAITKGKYFKCDAYVIDESETWEFSDEQVDTGIRDIQSDDTYTVQFSYHTPRE